MRTTRFLNNLHQLKYLKSKQYKRFRSKKTKGPKQDSPVRDKIFNKL